ncbi:50S ribosomal protein L5 [Guyparkeria hydrothermalis]|uniref:Large ribosomal subunit protein uL5 n=1 Tax=Guyparkeria halophila TaxID=47960 RepID=A0A6I6D6Y3_9GAMM|nr:MULTISPECIES: 50S ribosomal protein L5 [Guyparkeria]MCL7750788.1 50S ribosomal protein L5 [Guyparkeria hydrothermalis]QGT79221.1 50S ribosomal protein L5 [Guyparkeria halophila]TKA88849.1 50S ribosomal protein L5 [Guyparkeria sp. SB14A]
MARLQEYYSKTLRGELAKKLELDNVMAVPKLTKITLNMGLGDSARDKKVIDNAVEELGLITGQKPVVTYARKSIAGFKLREGMPLGVKVTLRGRTMYEFLDRLIHVASPRIRDFRGLSPKSFDGRGNYSLGVREQIIFPEIDFDKVDQVRGMDITITTTAKDNDQARALLDGFGFPFRR